MNNERVKLITEVDIDEASVSLESLKSELRDVNKATGRFASSLS